MNPHPLLMTAICVSGKTTPYHEPYPLQSFSSEDALGGYPIKMTFLEWKYLTFDKTSNDQIFSIAGLSEKNAIVNKWFFFIYFHTYPCTYSQIN